MAKKSLTYEEAVVAIEVLKENIEAYKNRNPPKGFVYKKAMQELMTLKRGLARRKKSSDD